MNAFLLAALAAVAAAENPGDLVGNGRLTAVVDQFGSVAVCRWPGPATNNQLGHGGARWGVVDTHKISWFNESPCKAAPVQPWTPGISAAIMTFPNGTAGIAQTFAAPDIDVLISHIELPDVQLPDLLWYADFSPTSLLMPELAGAAQLQDRDFAAYSADNRIYHFRPRSPGSKEWETAATRRWQDFAEAEGVWILIASPQTVRASCGLYGDPKSAPLHLAEFAVGDCDAALLLRPQLSPAGDGREVTVFAAFGDTREKAEAALDRAMLPGYYPFGEAARYWADFSKPPAPSDSSADVRFQKDLVTLGSAIDRLTGAFVRDPAAQPALCYTRDCAWASMALDLAGRQKEAGQVLAFAASLVRKEQCRGKPMGSLPIAAYSDGTEATPHLALDADAPAYTLAALYRHAAAITDDARRAEFTDAIWPAAELMAGFLTGWTDSRNRKPLYSFDMELGRDRQGPDRLLTTYMGVDAALRLARSANKPEPEDWARRKVELDTLIRFQLVERQPKAWKHGPILPYWHEMMAQDWASTGSSLPPWDNAVDRLLQSPASDPADAAATAALVWHNDKTRAADIAAAIEKALAAPQDLNALKAAQRIIARLASASL